MEWFNYVKKTPIAQLVVDWCEYRKLKKALYQAEKDMVQSGVGLVKYYDKGEDIRVGSACVKCKQLTDDMEMFVEDICHFSAKRCLYFGPKGNEQKCQNDWCMMRKENNIYCDNRQKFNEYERLCSQYWSNKFANVR